MDYITVDLGRADLICMLSSLISPDEPKHQWGHEYLATLNEPELYHLYRKTKGRKRYLDRICIMGDMNKITVELDRADLCMMLAALGNQIARSCTLESCSEFTRRWNEVTSEDSLDSLFELFQEFKLYRSA